MRPAFGGIDFGTSNSTVGILADGRARLVEVEDAQTTIPSAVFFNFEDNHTYFGRRAILDYTDNTEGRLLRALKSVLGSSLIHEKTRVKARSMAFSDIIGMFLGYLKGRLDTAMDCDVESVVLGRPVQFVDDDPQADRAAQDELEKAARAQGFKHIAFQYEPIAAALDYEQSVNSEQLALIVDIGGGTSDFSIVRVSPEGARAAERKQDILASTGVHIGGTDFDRLLSMASVMRELGYMSMTKDGKRHLPVGYHFDLATWQRIHMLYTQKAMIDLKQVRYEAEHPEMIDRMIDIVRHRQGHALAASVERAKIDLTDRDEAFIRLQLTHELLDVAVSQAQLCQAIDAAVDRVTSTVTRTLNEAQVSPWQVNSLFLTGGSTAVPVLRERILAMFPDASVVQGDMFGSVGLGLAIDADRKFA